MFIDLCQEEMHTPPLPPRIMAGDHFQKINAAWLCYVHSVAVPSVVSTPEKG